LIVAAAGVTRLLFSKHAPKEIGLPDGNIVLFFNGLWIFQNHCPYKKTEGAFSRTFGY
jgi:hypothetical protein